MNLKPMQDRLVIKPADEEQKTAGGIIVPDTATKEKPMQGEIIAAGPGKLGEDGKRLPLDVKVGDKVLFGKYSGNEVKVNDEELLVMREDDIMGIIE